LAVGDRHVAAATLSFVDPCLDRHPERLRQFSHRPILPVRLLLSTSDR